MPLARDLSDLPRAQPGESKGWAPDANPRFGVLLAEAWLAEERQRVVPRASAHARFRHSDAGACARMIAYAALDIDPTNPIDAAGVVTTTIGTWVHTQFQRVLKEIYGEDADIEVKVGTGDRAGHVDAVVRIQPPHGGIPWVVVIEFKTVGGYGWKMATGVPPAARQPEGPKYEHVLQGALGGREHNADEVVIVYLSKEAVSTRIARDRKISTLGRVTAEWSLSRETYEPLADKEAERIQGILGVLDQGDLPRRKVPDPALPTRHEIVRPADGAYVVFAADGSLEDGGVYWGCDYCRYQDLCAQTEGGRVPVSTLIPLGVTLKEGSN